MDSMARRTFIRPPATTRPLRPLILSTLSSSAFLICWAVAEGLNALSSAAAPATCGQAWARNQEERGGGYMLQDNAHTVMGLIALCEAYMTGLQHTHHCWIALNRLTMEVPLKEP